MNITNLGNGTAMQSFALLLFSLPHTTQKTTRTAVRC